MNEVSLSYFSLYRKRWVDFTVGVCFHLLSKHCEQNFMANVHPGKYHSHCKTIKPCEKESKKREASHDTPILMSPPSLQTREYHKCCFVVSLC